VTTNSKFTSGLSWNTLTVVLQVFIQLVYTGLLARLLAPEAFMLMGLVLSIIGFAEIFSQVGVGPALIQRKEIHQQHINGAFYTALILGLLFTLIFIVGAPSIAEFYHLSELKPITQVVCTSFTISALAVVPRNMMMKEMRFKTMFKASMISIIGGNLVVGLTLAYLNYGVWAYVWALFTQNALMTIALWVMQPVKVTTNWQWSYTAELMRYGVGSTGHKTRHHIDSKVSCTARN
jgi:lipopolysaccharide exporter